ncbi:RbsD/FucU domain-containing protein [Streptomyces violaceusniger]
MSLKGLDPLLTPNLLYALARMGHGDTIVIVDGNSVRSTPPHHAALGEETYRRDPDPVPAEVRFTPDLAGACATAPRTWR